MSARRRDHQAARLLLVVGGVATVAAIVAGTRYVRAAGVAGALDGARDEHVREPARGARRNPAAALDGADGAVIGQRPADRQPGAQRRDGGGRRGRRRVRHHPAAAHARAAAVGAAAGRVRSRQGGIRRTPEGAGGRGAVGGTAVDGRARPARSRAGGADLQGRGRQAAAGGGRCRGEGRRATAQARGRAPGRRRRPLHRPPETRQGGL